jgi:hypothetical protein
MNAGASRLVFQTLRDLGLLRHALAVAGIGDTTHDRSGDQYPLRPWFSIRTRTAIAAEARLWSVALLEIMADHPDLQRAVALNDSIPALPLPCATISTRLRTFAWAAAAAGAHDSAKRAWDLAGDDVALANLAVQLINSPRIFAVNECGKQLARDLNTALDTAVGSEEDHNLVDGATLRVVMRIFSDESLDGDLLSAALLPTCRLTAPARRFELLPSHGTLEHMQLLPAEAKALSAPEFVTRATIVKVLGADRMLKHLRLNSAEEWFGRARPECLVEESEVDWLDGAGQGYNSNEVDECNKLGWEKGVGSNKHDDANLTGYWRFGEGSKTPPIDNNDADGESFVVCPPSLEDISGYGGRAQLIAENPGAVLLAVSTCSRLDEGEESSTHVAHDLVFASPPPAAGSNRDGHSMRGLLINVARGGALDLGIFHEDPHRSSLTVEFWIKVPPLANSTVEASEEEADDYDHDKEDKKTQPLPFSTTQTLISRYLCSGHRIDMWALTLSPNGTLSVALTASEDKQQAHSSGGIIAGKWCHVALVLSTRDSLIWTFEEPTTSQQVDVLLYLDGEEVIQSKLPVCLPTPPLAIYFEENSSQIMVGQNLGYHSRITELRFWACRRKQNDIQVSMENYLPQASKKRIKKFVINKAMTAPTRASPFALNAPPASQQLLKSPPLKASGAGGRGAVEDAHFRRRRRNIVSSREGPAVIPASNAVLETEAPSVPPRDPIVIADKAAMLTDATASRIDKSDSALSSKAVTVGAPKAGRGTWAESLFNVPPAMCLVLAEDSRAADCPHPKSRRITNASARDGPTHDTVSKRSQPSPGAGGAGAGAGAGASAEEGPEVVSVPPQKGDSGEKNAAARSTPAALPAGSEGIAEFHTSGAAPAAVPVAASAHEARKVLSPSTESLGAFPKGANFEKILDRRRNALPEGPFFSFGHDDGLMIVDFPRNEHSDAPQKLSFAKFPIRATTTLCAPFHSRQLIAVYKQAADGSGQIQVVSVKEKKKMREQNLPDTTSIDFLSWLPRMEKTGAAIGEEHGTLAIVTASAVSYWAGAKPPSKIFARFKLRSDRNGEEKSVHDVSDCQASRDGKWTILLCKGIGGQNSFVQVFHLPSKRHAVWGGVIAATIFNPPGIGDPWISLITPQSRGMRLQAVQLEVGLLTADLPQDPTPPPDVAARLVLSVGEGDTVGTRLLTLEPPGADSMPLLVALHGSGVVHIVRLVKSNLEVLLERRNLNTLFEDKSLQFCVLGAAAVAGSPSCVSFLLKGRNKEGKERVLAKRTTFSWRYG